MGQRPEGRQTPWVEHLAAESYRRGWLAPQEAGYKTIATGYTFTTLCECAEPMGIIHNEVFRNDVFHVRALQATESDSGNDHRRT